MRDLIEGNAAALRPKKKVEGSEEEDEEDKEGEGEDKEEDEQDEEEKEEQAYRGGRKSGLRKVRLGAFEDTGKCKG